MSEPNWAQATLEFTQLKDIYNTYHENKNITYFLQFLPLCQQKIYIFCNYKVSSLSTLSESEAAINQSICSFNNIC